MTIYYRCLLCAPGREWPDDAQAAIRHLSDEHVRDDDDALVLAVRWMVTDDDPEPAITDADDESAISGRLTWQ